MAISGGREIASAINNLLSLPFAVKIATKDFHPLDHVSFETSNPPPDNKAFESYVKIPNPSDPSDSQRVPIWPVHCVQGTKGAAIIPQLDTSKLTKVLEKGRDRNVEMFSGFANCFGNKTDAASFDLAEVLREAAISHVYVVGLAGDFCVRCTAIDAKKEGFKVYVVDDATRSVDPGETGWGLAKKELQQLGIETVSMGGPELDRVRNLAGNQSIDQS